MFFISQIKNSQGFLSRPSLVDVVLLFFILFQKQLKNANYLHIHLRIPVVCNSNTFYIYTHNTSVFINQIVFIPYDFVSGIITRKLAAAYTSL